LTAPFCWQAEKADTAALMKLASADGTLTEKPQSFNSSTGFLQHFSLQTPY